MVVLLCSLREVVAVQTWSSTFAAAFRSGLKLISGAGVGSFLLLSQRVSVLPAL